MNRGERALTAAGKLFVAGEYAVLWGGEARVVCVGPRAAALVRTAESRRVTVVLEGARLTGDTTPLGVRWHEAVSEEFRFAATTLDLALRAAGTESAGFSLALEPTQRVDGHKLGLGSSARTAVLVAEAARWALGASYDALKLALVAHSDAQGGKGSGADVSASFAGELIRYRRYDVSQLALAARKPGFAGALAAAPTVEIARTGYTGPPIIYAFTGQQASTSALVREVELRVRGVERTRFVERSDGLSLELEHALKGGDFSKVRHACMALQSLLDSLGVERPETLGRVLAMAETFGCTGKQSGAGGGDGVLLFAPDFDARHALVRALESRGYFARPLVVEGALRGEAAGAPKLRAWLDASEG